MIATPDGSYSENAVTLFEEGEASFNRQDWIRAESAYREVTRKYTYSKYAVRAELRIADIRFAQQRWPEARAAYEQWLRDHLSDEERTRHATERIEAIKKRDAG